MYGKKGAHRHTSIAKGLRVPTSVYNEVIPVVYGRMRVAPKMIWAGNFQSHSGGGKGKKGGNVPTYSVNADFLCGFSPIQSVCSVYFDKNYWVAGYWYQAFNVAGPASSYTFTLTVPANGTVIEGVTSVQILQAYSVTYNDYGDAMGNRSYSGNTYLPLHNQNFPAPNHGDWQYAGIPYATFNNALHDVNVTVHFPAPVATCNAVISFVYSFDGGQGSLDALQTAGLQFERTLGTGSEGAPQTFVDFSGCGGTNLDLGSANVMHTYSFECIGLYGYSPYQVPTAGPMNISIPTGGDCNPADIMLDIVCSGNRTGAFIWQHGLNLHGAPGMYTGTANTNVDFSRFGSILQDESSLWSGGSGNIGLNWVRNYCQAYGIWISNVIETQTKANTLMEELCDIANCAGVYDGYQLWIIPYCEVSNYGFGASYIAPTASGPLLTLDDRDYLQKSPQNPKSPLLLTRSRPSDNYNSLAIDYIHRDAQMNGIPVAPGNVGMYNADQVIVSDTGDIAVQGIRPGTTKSFKWIQDPTTATNVAWPILRRQILVNRKQYKWSSSPGRTSLLLPMDLVQLTEPSLTTYPFTPTNLAAASILLPVRLTKVTENPDWSMDFEAEPFIYGASAPFPASNTSVSSSTGGSVPGQNVVPGNVNTPIFIEACPKLSTSPQIWICLSGASQYWGGCDVWMSTDGGSNYSLVGRQIGRQTMGVNYSATYPSSPDPDAADTLSVNLVSSLTTLSSFTTSQRDSFLSVCYLSPGGTINVAGKTLTIPYELVAYATATLAGTNLYTLPPTIRRGVFNTPIVAHPVGSAFSFVEDNNVFKFALNPNWVGVTLYFKFTSFNTFLTNEQALSSVSPYTFTPSGMVGWNLSYSVLPQPSVYQGKSGGWTAGTGGDANSTTWTDPTKVYFPSITVVFPSGTVVNYAARDSGLSVFSSTSGGQTAYVSIYDPTQVGEPTGSATLTAYADLSPSTHYNLAGYVQIGTVVSQPYTVGGGGGGGYGGQSSPNANDVYFFVPGTYTNGQLLYYGTPVRQASFPTNLAASVATCNVAATGSVSCNLYKNWSIIGTINFAAGSHSATMNVNASVSFNGTSDTFAVLAPATADTTLAGISVSIQGTRSN